jgi:hypothetical protein
MLSPDIQIYCWLVSPQDKTRYFTLSWITKTNLSFSSIYLLNVLFGDRTNYVTSENLFHLEIGWSKVPCIDYVTTHYRHWNKSIGKEIAITFFEWVRVFFSVLFSAHVLKSMWPHSYTKWRAFVCVFVHKSGAADLISTKLKQLSYLRIIYTYTMRQWLLKTICWHVAVDVYLCFDRHCHPVFPGNIYYLYAVSPLIFIKILARILSNFWFHSIP